MTALTRPGNGLSEAMLGRLPLAATAPAYDRSRLRGGVVHIGVGGFHRAHQALYFDELARSGAGPGWGITGVSLRHRAVADALAAQDGLYTVIARDGDGERACVAGALRRVWYGPDDRGRVVTTLADARTRLVTLTITGDGYTADGTGPDTVFGYLVDALARRRAAGSAPFTVLSCDNIADNGAAARAGVLAEARRREEVLARWIERNVAFPASMVDRITRAATDADRERLAVRLGIDDRAAVVTETFSQWVIEDAFSHGRPPLEEVGVAFVSDVAPYRLVKTRLLNGVHSALGYLGLLAGHRTSAEAMADPPIRAYVTRLMVEEIAPLLPAVPGLDIAAYCRTLIRRLANPSIADPVARLCARGSTKVPAYLLPSLAEATAAGRPHARLALGVAAWLKSLRGRDFAGAPIAVEDVRHRRLRALAAAGGDDPRPLLGERDVFGDLAADRVCVAALERALRDLGRDGLAALDGRRRAADPACAA